MKKSLLALGILFTTALTVTATASAQTAAPTADTSLSGTVRVGSWESGSALTAWTDSISDFSKLYPNITVQLEAVPNNYGTNLLAEFAAGNAPDVFMVGDGDVSKFKALGAATDLAPYISGKNGFDPSVSYPAVAAFGNVGKSTYYMTKDYSPLVAYYNTDLFKTAGVTAPTANWTWDEMLKDAQKLTVDASGNDATSAKFDPKHIKQWGLMIPDGWGAPDWARGIEPLIYQGGGDLVSADGTTTTGHMNSDATVAALQWYVDLFNKYHVAPTKTDVASFSGTDMFQSKLVAILWTGVWPLSGYKKVSGLNFATVQLPAGTKGTGNVLCWSGFALNANSKNKDAAWAFLKFMATGGGAQHLSTYALTAIKSIADAQGLTKDQYEGSVMSDLANVKPIPESTTQYWADCGDKFFTQELDTVFDSGVAIKDAMNKAASEADLCLAQKAKS